MNDMLNSGPSSPEQAMEDYLFEMFDDEVQPGASDEVDRSYDDVAVFDCGGVRVGIDASRMAERFGLDTLEAELEAQGVQSIKATWRGKSVRLLDVAALILPNDLPSLATALAERATEAVMLDAENGILVGPADEQAACAPERNRWRTSAERKPWLAGVNVESRTVLLDVDELLRQLSRRR